MITFVGHGRTLHYTYDALGRLTSATNSNSHGSETIHYAYERKTRCQISIPSKETRPATSP